MTPHDRPAPHPATDRDLLDRWTEGEDAEAFRELVARHGRMVLGVCRRILGDVHLADDMAQDCFLRLAEQRSRPARDVGGWLHTVAANAARSARRDRRRREAAPIEEVGKEQADPSTPPRVAAWRELEGEVDAAIAVLPEPLRAVVVGHFLEGRSHRELGRALGLGDRTVGYRITKGIERLRRELAARGIRIDRDALGAALVALPMPASVPGVWGSSLGKVALLGAQPLTTVGGVAAVGLGTAGSAKSVVMAVAAVAALALAWLWGEAAWNVDPERDGVDKVPALRAAAIPEAPSETRSDVPDPAQRAVVAAPPEAPPVADDEVVVRGRCVDEAGNPLTGVRTALHGWVGNDRDLAVWELEHGAITWEDPADCTTDRDGRFEYRFVAPPAAYRISCRLLPIDRVPLGVAWSGEDLEPGTVVDLGEVTLEVGVRLSGRMVDEAGAPIADQTLALRSPAFSRSKPAHQPSASVGAAASTDGRGRFEFERRFPDGADVLFQVGGRPVLQPTDPLSLRGPTTDVEVVAHRGSLPSVQRGDRSAEIRGRVVDATGHPISGAGLYRRRVPTFADAWAPTSTGESGRFVLQRSGSASPEMPLEQLHVHARGFEPWTSPASIPWGTSNLEVRMLSGPSLELVVRRSDDGRPVERYLAILEPLDPEGRPVSSAHARTELADDPRGLLRFERLTPARYRVSIRARESELLATNLAHEVSLEPGTPASLEIALAALHSRRVVARREDGTPMAGARIELLRHRKDGLVRIGMMATSIENSRNHLAPGHDETIAIKADEATTAADGTATLTGPAGVPFSIRMPGPGHMPLLVQPVDLGEESVLELTVSLGASLSGSVAPLEVLEQLRAEGGPVGIRLIDPSGTRPDVPARSSDRFGALVDEQGRFHIDGVPSGVWEVRILWGRNQDNLMPFTMTSQVGHTLRHGMRIGRLQASELALDLEPLRRARVAARITLDGSPVRGIVDLTGQVAYPTTPGLISSHFLITCDEDGHADLALPAGTWHTTVHVRHGNEFRSYDGPQFVLERSVPPTAPWEIAVRSEPGNGR